MSEIDEIDAGNRKVTRSLRKRLSSSVDRDESPLVSTPNKKTAISAKNPFVALQSIPEKASDDCNSSIAKLVEETPKKSTSKTNLNATDDIGSPMRVTRSRRASTLIEESAPVPSSPSRRSTRRGGSTEPNAPVAPIRIMLRRSSRVSTPTIEENPESHKDERNESIEKPPNVIKENGHNTSTDSKLTEDKYETPNTSIEPENMSSDKKISFANTVEDDISPLYPKTPHPMAKKQIQNTNSNTAKSINLDESSADDAGKHFTQNDEPKSISKTTSSQNDGEIVKSVTDETNNNSKITELIIPEEVRVEQFEDKETAHETVSQAESENEKLESENHANPEILELDAGLRLVDTSVSSIESNDKENKNISIPETDNDEKQSPIKANVQSLLFKSQKNSTPFSHSDNKRASINVPVTVAKTQECEKKLSKSWCQSVTGSAVRLEYIDGYGVAEKSQEEAGSFTENKTEQVNKNNEINEEKTNEEDAENAEEEDENAEEEDENEEDEDENKEKNEFIDDEAMEVSDEEDSIDEEERNYIKENEIPVDSISIGSEDTEDDNDEDEDDDADTSFLELEPIDDDDDFGVNVSQNKKKYSRILDISSSDSDVEEVNSENMQKLKAIKMKNMEKLRDQNILSKSFPGHASKNVEESNKKKLNTTENDALAKDVDVLSFKKSTEQGGPSVISSAVKNTPTKNQTSPAKSPAAFTAVKHSPEKMATSPAKSPAASSTVKHTPEKMDTSVAKSPAASTSLKHTPEKMKAGNASPEKSPAPSTSVKHTPEKLKAGSASPVKSKPITPQTKGAHTRSFSLRNKSITENKSEHLENTETNKIEIENVEKDFEPDYTVSTVDIQSDAANSKTIQNEEESNENDEVSDEQNNVTSDDEDTSHPVKETKKPTLEDIMAKCNSIVSATDEEKKRLRLESQQKNEEKKERLKRRKELKLIARERKEANKKILKEQEEAKKKRKFEKKQRKLQNRDEKQDSDEEDEDDEEIDSEIEIPKATVPKSKKAKMNTFEEPKAATANVDSESETESEEITEEEKQAAIRHALQVKKRILEQGKKCTDAPFIVIENSEETSTSAKSLKSKKVKTAVPSTLSFSSIESNSSAEIKSNKQRKRHSTEIEEPIEKKRPKKILKILEAMEKPENKQGKIKNKKESADNNIKNEMNLLSGKPIQLNIYSKPTTTTKLKPSTSNKKTKRKIEEPKSIWTSSGDFTVTKIIPTDIQKSRKITTSTTDFFVTSLDTKSSKKTKQQSASAATSSAVANLNSVNFKQQALFGKHIKRETSQQLLQRKQKQKANLIP